jgi:hypothetical protein
LNDKQSVLPFRCDHNRPFALSGDRRVERQSSGCHFRHPRGIFQVVFNMRSYPGAHRRFWEPLFFSFIASRLGLISAVFGLALTTLFRRISHETVLLSLPKWPTLSETVIPAFRQTAVSSRFSMVRGAILFFSFRISLLHNELLCMVSVQYTGTDFSVEGGWAVVYPPSFCCTSLLKMCLCFLQSLRFCVYQGTRGCLLN